MRVQAKLKRLLAGSSLIMLMGFAAVIAAIFYKINSSDKVIAAKSIPDTIVLGAGRDVLDVELTDDRMLVLVQDGKGKALLHLDPVSGALIGETRLLSGPQ